MILSIFTMQVSTNATYQVSDKNTQNQNLTQETLEELSPWINKIKQSNGHTVISATSDKFVTLDARKMLRYMWKVASRKAKSTYQCK